MQRTPRFLSLIFSLFAIGMLDSETSAQTIRHVFTLDRAPGVVLPNDVISNLMECQGQGCEEIEAFIDIDTSVPDESGLLPFSGLYTDAVVRIGFNAGGQSQVLDAVGSTVEIRDNRYQTVSPFPFPVDQCSDEVRLTVQVLLPTGPAFVLLDAYQDNQSVYYGASCPSMISGAGLQEPINFQATAQFSSARLLISPHPDGVSPGSLQLSGSTVRSESGNDSCADAQELPDYGLYGFDTTLATTDGSDMTGFCDLGTFGDNQIYDDIWFAIRPSQNGCTYISTLGSPFDTRLAVYEALDCPDDPARLIACSSSEMQPPVAPFEAGLDVVLSHNRLYYIRVGSAMPGLNGAGSLEVSHGSQARANDGGLQPGALGCLNDSSFPEFCFGDGGDGMGCTPCACGNEYLAATMGGCLNSAGASAKLLASGSASVSLSSQTNTDLRFALLGATANTFCILSSGAALAPAGAANPCFGTNSGIPFSGFDGLRCVVQSVQRHGTRASNAEGQVGVTTESWGGANGPAGGLWSQGPFVAGQVRHFQVVYRDDALANCMTGLNTTQAVSVTFVP